MTSRVSTVPKNESTSCGHTINSEYIIFKAFIHSYCVPAYIFTFLFAVALSGEAIQARHCAVENSSGKVRLILADGRCYVNQDEVSDDTDLSHGTNIQCATLNFEDRL